MTPLRARPLPISARHAFALAFDLAMRRDALHSLVVPLAIRAPWILATALIPSPDFSSRPGLTTALSALALIGDFLAMLLVASMMRFRARSVFNTPPSQPPAPAGECYAEGLRRLPWLSVTEVVRNVAIGLAVPFLFLPAIWLAFRLSMATEAVVLREKDTSAAFGRSFRITVGRFERWLEMIALSVVLFLSAWFTVAFLSLSFPGPGFNTWVSVLMLLSALIIPILQYAWTFFYLRLEEIDAPPLREVEPQWASGGALAVSPMALPAAARPTLRLVDSRSEQPAEDPPTV